MKKSTSFGAIPGTLIGALVLSACAPAGGSNGPESAPPYVYAIDDDPRGLNAQFVGAPMTAMFSAQMLEPLVFLSSTYQMSPGLATDTALSDDGLTLTVQLRGGVTWHDGEPFTAEDVKFNFEEIVPLNSYGAAISERLESVEIQDESTVILRLTEPYGPLLETLSSQYMLPKHVYEGTDYVTNPANMAPVGTGPMKFDDYSSGESITLVKNHDYWGGEVAVDSAVFPIMGDATSRTESLFAGEVDQTVVDITALNRIADDPNTQQLGEFGFPQDIALMFNAESEYLTDPDVRQAVFATFDREALVETALQGQGVPADGFFPPAMEWSVSPNVSFSDDFPHDTGAIEEILDDAGLPRGADGTRFTLDIRYTTERTDTAAMAEMARSLFAEVGIELNLDGTSATVFTEKVYSESDFDLALLPATVGADPSIGITRWYTCNEDKAAGRNPSQVCGEEIETAANQALDSAKHEERAEALSTLQDRASDLMFYAPLVWFNGQFPSVNTTRWSGQGEPQPIASRVPWISMTYTGD
ncbi:ABC transporter substrate-binding protein [Microbacterium faecale]|uniref:ABC transporter substrate-binding protein n=1 Tax=Microbacterium faecale TaxID=1804630 RepID=A0A916YI15_9MICO|nr:ABC transporter substrate-binding protein [Microbacterium faecale]GGD44115.1 ABC transporter substrate-binding protein [Microbacterium faecale]